MRQSCYANGTCNAGLVCLSNVCVSEGTGGAGGVGAPATGGTGGTTGGAGTTGTAGTTGGAGATGAAGTTGGAGATGAAGTTGGAGATGAAGTIGGAGTTGAAGKSGSAGAAGSTGVAGTTGAGGAAGSGSSACWASASYSQTTLLGADGQTTRPIGSGSTSYYEEIVSGGLNQGAMPDVLQIIVASNQGHFPGNITTGTFTLTAADGQAETCSICVLLYAATTVTNQVVTGEQATYLANGGTLTLTSVAAAGTGTGTIAGTLTNATFQQVTIDETSGVSTVVGTCTSTIPSLTFSASSTLDP